MPYRVALEYHVGQCTPPAVMAELATRLGARHGDAVRVYECGRVELVRVACNLHALPVLACLSDGRDHGRSRAAAG